MRNVPKPRALITLLCIFGLAPLCSAQTQQAQNQELYNQFLQQQGYPFQVAQFLANIAEGTGALSGSTTSSYGQGFAQQPQPFFSDERLKEDMKVIGKTKDGQNIYSFRYRGSPHTQIGMSAQEVEKKHPEAVGLAGGYKTVDYKEATRHAKAGGGLAAFGGPVANDNAGQGYADGGVPIYDPQVIAQILAAQHMSMYPGAHDPTGIGAGTGPRGMQLAQSGNRGLMTAKEPAAMKWSPPPESELRSDLKAVGDVSGAVKGGKDLYNTGKDVYDWASKKLDPNSNIDQQIADWSNYGSSPSGLGTQRGGRIKRYARGGNSPYGDDTIYDFNVDDNTPDVGKLENEQKGLGTKPMDMSMKGGSGDSTMGDIKSGLGMLSSIASIAALFNRGGRTGYDEGGDVDPAESQGLGAAMADNVVPFPKTPEARTESRLPEFDRRRVKRVDEELPAFDPLHMPEPKSGLGAAVEPQQAMVPPGAAPSPAAPSGLMPPPKAIAPDRSDAPESVASRHWQQESGDRQFDPKTGQVITSPKGAVGRSQLFSAGPDAAKLAGVPWDAQRAKTDEQYNRLLGDTWLNHLNQKYGDPYKAAAAYNAGEGATDKALQLSANTGKNWWETLPAETKNHLYVVSQGKLGEPLPNAGQQTAMNGPPPTGGPPPSGLGTTPPDPNAQQAPGFFEKKGWLDRNEREIVGGLSFLGNMLGSDRRTLAGAVGQGLAAAAPAYQQAGFRQTGLEQGQQQIDISKIAQYNSLLAQLRAMQNARRLRGEAPDPQLEEQISNIARVISNAATGGAGFGSSPSGQTSTPALPPSPAPAPNQMAGPGASAPATTPAEVTSLVAKHPDLEPLQGAANSQEFLNNVHPDENFLELYRRADELAAGNAPMEQIQAAQNRAKAAADSAKDRGYVMDKNSMPILIPGMPQTQRQLSNIKYNNDVWSPKQDDLNQNRQSLRQGLDLIREALSQVKTNAGAEVGSEFIRLARAANINVKSGTMWNPDAVQEIKKQVANMAQATGDTDLGHRLSQVGNIDPVKEPEANKKILAQAYADLNQLDDKAHYLMPRVRATPQFDTAGESQKWIDEHPRSQYYEKAYRETPVLGDAPVDRNGTPVMSEMKQGNTYLLTPEQAYQATGTWFTKPVRMTVRNGKYVNLDSKGAQ